MLWEAGDGWEMGQEGTLYVASPKLRQVGNAVALVKAQEFEWEWGLKINQLRTHRMMIWEAYGFQRSAGYDGREGRKAGCGWGEGGLLVVCYKGIWLCYSMTVQRKTE